MNDRDRAAWPGGIDDEGPEQLWIRDEFMVDEQLGSSDPTGSLISLAFIGDVLRRRTWLWCITAVLGLLIGTGLYVKYPPAYHAQASVLLIDNSGQDPAVEVLTDLSLAQSEPVAAQVVKELGLSQSVPSLQAAYTVTPFTNTVLKFDVGAPSTAAALQQAGALASAFLQYRAKYAQTQEQQLTAQLDQQYSAAQQRLQAIQGQIAQLPTTQLTPAQKIQLDNLQIQQAKQNQIMQYAVATQISTKSATAAMVSGSYVLDPPVAVAHSRLKSMALYVAGGLFVGLVLGMAIAIIAALLSGRLRRRDDVAAVLGAPVRLSVGRLRLPRWRPSLPRRAAKRNRDLKRVAAYLRGALSGSSRDPVSLSVVAVDHARDIAPAVASLATSLVKEGRQVVVADLSSGAPLARLLGARKPGVHEVSRDGGCLRVAVPGRDDAVPVGPVPTGSFSTVWAEPDDAVVSAYSSADVLLSLVTLDPALGSDHLTTWASEAIVVVTAGRSSIERVHSVGEMIRLTGTRLDSAVLIGADRSDASLGTPDPAYPFVGGVSQPGKPERGGEVES